MRNLSHSEAEHMRFHKLKADGVLSLPVLWREEPRTWERTQKKNPGADNINKKKAHLRGPEVSDPRMLLLISALTFES